MHIYNQIDFVINVGDYVQIGEIEEDIYTFLSRKKGVVTQVLDSPVRRCRGYIIRVIGIEGEEKEWFVECRYVTRIERDDR